VPAYLTAAANLDFYLVEGGGSVQIAIAVLSIQLALYLECMYERIVAFATILRRMFFALGVGFLIQAFLALLHSPLQLARGIMVAAGGLSLVAFPVWRLAAGAVMRTGIPARKILFLGANSASLTIERQLKEQPELGLMAAGFLGTGEGGETFVRLGDFTDLDTVIEEHSPQRIVLARGVSGLPVRRLLELQRSGTRIEKLANLYESVTGRISLHELPPERLMFSEDLDARPGYVAARDVYSVAIAALLLAIAAPVFAAAVLISKARGPIFAWNLHLGVRGKPVRLYRFRDPGLWSWVQALPLLLNVLKGDLALVGPAPERVEFAAALRRRIPFYNHRLSVKPGLTGWAQVHSDTGTPDSLAALEYDLYYIKHLSPVLDAYIVVLTIRAIAGWSRL